MKKLVLSVAIALCSVASMNAQTFAKGENVLGADVGFGGSYGIPVSISYEHGIYDINKKMSIGAGGIIGYGSSSDKMSYGKWTYSNTLIGARGAFHYTGIKKLDLLGGLTLGYNIVSAKWKGDGPDVGGADSSGLLWGVYAGARYYFNQKFGINAEVGYGIANVNVGLSYKF